MRRIGIFVERHWHYGRSICEGAAAFAIERGDWSFDFPDWEALSSPAALRKYDGFIARVFDREMADALFRTGKPVADVFGGGFRREFAVADQNSAEIGAMAARHFIEHRFTRFAFLGYANHHYSVQRRAAYEEELRRNGYELGAAFEDRTTSTRMLGRQVLKMGTFDFHMNRRSVAKWARSLAKPCAVFCSHDIVAWNLAKICGDAGIPVPDGIAILGVGDDPILCRFTTPSISSIDSNAFEIGRGAARLLAALLERPGQVPEGFYPPPIGVSERDSTRVYPIAPSWLSDALVFIRRNIDRNLTAADVFAHLGLSHTTVSRAFRDKLGHNVQQEIMRVRIETAKHLLARSGITLAETGRRAGFASKSYFTSQFKAATGATPGEWRARRIRP